MCAVTALFTPFLLNAKDRLMGFFGSSVGIGIGADLGGSKDGDAHCKKPATADGTGDRD